MKYLVAANVLNEATKPSPDSKAMAWLEAHEREIAVDAIILGEIHFGILLLPGNRRRQRLEEWFQNVVASITGVLRGAEFGLNCSLAAEVGTSHANRGSSHCGDGGFIEPALPIIRLGRLDESSVDENLSVRLR